MIKYLILLVILFFTGCGDAYKIKENSEFSKTTELNATGYYVNGNGTKEPSFEGTFRGDSIFKVYTRDGTIPIFIIVRNGVADQGVSITRRVGKVMQPSTSIVVKKDTIINKKYIINGKEISESELKSIIEK